MLPNLIHVKTKNKMLFTSDFKPKEDEGSSSPHSSQEPWLDSACSSQHQRVEGGEDQDMIGPGSGEAMEDAAPDQGGGMGDGGYGMEGGMGDGGADQEGGMGDALLDHEQQNQGVRTIVAVI